jgi:CBS domain-containing protein
MGPDSRLTWRCAVTQNVADLMTKLVVQLPQETTLVEAAQAMRDGEIGDVVVTAQGALIGLATDRDIVVRAVAEGKDPATTRLGDILTADVVRVREDASVNDAADLMRQHSVRRLVVTDDADKVAGVISLGDLAVARDPDSTLGAISAAPSNN